MDDQPLEGIGIRIYNAAPPQNDCSSAYPSTPQSPPAAGGGGRKRRAVASGVQKTLSKTSMLANFLATGTLVAVEMVLPTVYGRGECSAVSTLMMDVLLALCTFSCFFFHFTDSFWAADGEVYYDFVTTKGWRCSSQGWVEVPREEKFKVALAEDFVHALMYVMVFAAIALSDHRVTNCLFPRHAREMEEVMESLPLMVGIVCSGLFLVFPRTRYGIGCMAT